MRSTAVRLPPVLLLAVILHTSVLPQFRLFGVGADLLLLMAVAVGYVGGPERGAWVGFGIGLLADCFLQSPFGLSALVFTFVGWAVGSFQASLLYTGWWVPVLTAAAASAVGVLAFVGTGAVLGQDHLVTDRLPTVIGVVAGLNAVLSLVAVPAVRWAVADKLPSAFARPRPMGIRS